MLPATNSRRAHDPDRDLRGHSRPVVLEETMKFLACFLSTLIGFFSAPRKVRMLEAENKALKEKLALATQFALQDALTGLLNRRSLNEKLKEFENVKNIVPRRSHQLPKFITFLAIDLVGFKAVNSAFGHDGGDRALIAVAKAIRDSIRGDDHSVYRPGGDEFVVILSGASQKESEIVAQRIMKAIRAISEYHLSCRIGGTVWNVEDFPAANTQKILNAADQLEAALNAAGKDGEFDIQQYTPEN
jgi:diguanylate cyclase (GGDEF)-like protein